MAHDLQHALIQSLRRTGSERQLTRALVDIGEADEAFARSLMKALLNSTPGGTKLGKALGSIAEVQCFGERPLFDRAGLPLGRIDLVFESAETTLFVEVKLHSDYRPNQLADYLTGISPGGGDRLMAVTRNLSKFIEPRPGSPGWLGSVRWAELMPALRKLEASDGLRSQWQVLLDVLEEDGDMGKTGMSKQLLTAYERSNESWERLEDFLEQIGTLALPILRSELSGGDRDKRSAATFAPGRRRRASKAKRLPVGTDPDSPKVLYVGDDIYLGFEIPAGGPQRLFIGFTIDERTAVFYIGASPKKDPPPPAQRAKWIEASESLRPLMRKSRRFYCNDDDDFYVQVDYRLADYVRPRADVPKKLGELVEADLPKFVRAGLFDK